MSTVFLLVGVLVVLALVGPVIAGLYLFSRLKQRNPGTSGGLTAAVIVGGVAALVLLPVLAFAVFGLASFSSPGPGSQTSVTVEVPVPSPDPSVLPGVVPSVVGLQEEVARRMLAAAGLTVTTFPHGDLHTPPGEVDGQDPAAGTRLAPGSTVTLSVSMGAY